MFAFQISTGEPNRARSRPVHDAAIAFTVLSAAQTILPALLPFGELLGNSTYVELV
ncbi:hypothetical protein GRI89_03385 [Altererythrobacter salegens]|uniref:Uncharacterized protein n=1 Tax=Croceibacterium salegens TaxID=1737568 RepID=A0A6I4SRY3_9SPHN|nr:hypothetical protein [Croceibacterium salegens]MXO58585.1 hypothetical protein [Croceibacterium salegens]